jgi:NADH dehydrogenase FAD-containing subunit
VLVGGGHAHALLLQQWALRPLPGIELQLVSPEPVSLYSGMLPGWLAGRWREEDLQIDLQPLCRAAGARLLLDEALALEPQARRLRLARGGTLPYDLLSINTGSTLNAPEHAGPVLALRPLSSLVQRWPALLQAWRSG